MAADGSPCQGSRIGREMRRIADHADLPKDHELRAVAEEFDTICNDYFTDSQPRPTTAEFLASLEKARRIRDRCKHLLWA